MKTAYIFRTYKDSQTEGILTCEDFTCKTLERAWLNNQKRISCIPEGIYICSWDLLNRHNTFHYLIKSVSDRDRIFIHGANYSSELFGCIALGSEFKDLNLDGKNDVIHSGKTIKAFEALFNKEDFKLIIRS